MSVVVFWGMTSYGHVGRATSISEECVASIFRTALETVLYTEVSGLW